MRYVREPQQSRSAKDRDNYSRFRSETTCHPPDLLPVSLELNNIVPRANKIDVVRVRLYIRDIFLYVYAVSYDNLR